MQCRKNTTVKDNRRKMNIVNFINKYIYIYIYIYIYNIQIYMPILYVTRMTQNKND